MNFDVLVHFRQILLSFGMAMSITRAMSFGDGVVDRSTARQVDFPLNLLITCSWMAQITLRVDDRSHLLEAFVSYSIC